MVFTVTIETALRSLARGWDRPGILLTAYGTAVFVAYLASYRYLSMQLASYPWVFGPLLLLAMGSVIYGYVRITKKWEREAAAEATVRVPEPRREPQPELV